MPYTWSTFKTAVRRLMTDASLTDSVAAMAVAEFVKAKIAGHVDKNPALSRSHMSEWLNQRGRLVGYAVTLSRDLFRAQVNRFLTVDADRVGIQEFIDVQIEIALAEFNGLDSFIDSSTRQGVIEMEHFIPFYRNNHETRYAITDVADEGEASRGLLPDQCMIWDSYYVKGEDGGEPCVRMPITQYDWQNRFDLTCGSPRMDGHDFFMAIEPNARTFLLFPPILEENYLSVFWDGLKLEWLDAEMVPFDEGFAEAIANYVLYKIYLRTESLNTKLAAAHEQLYRAKRLQLFRDTQDRTIIRYKNDSPQPASIHGCGNSCAATGATGSFGDGTIPPVPVPYS